MPDRLGDQIRLASRETTDGTPPTEQIRALMARLDLPPNATWRFVRLTPTPAGQTETLLAFPIEGEGVGTLRGHVPGLELFSGRRDYCLELFGVAEPPAVVAGENYSIFRIHQDGDGQRESTVFGIQLWHQAARPLGSQLSAVVRWHPVYGETRAIEGLTHGSRQQDVVRAWKGLGVLKRRPREMRTRAPVVDPAYFAIELPRRYFAYLAKHGRRPSQQTMAETFAISHETFKDYLRDNDIAWPPLGDPI